MQDCSYYKQIALEAAKALHVDVHAYAFCMDRIHFLATFHREDAASRFMQTLGLKYVAYFNKKYARSGTLWQGRYKSSFVEDRYILSVMHYIETLPQAFCSSAAHNKELKEDALVSAHQMYRLLASTKEDRAKIYLRRYGYGALDSALSEFIATHLRRQSITGSESFYEKLEAQTGLTLRAKRRGRPKKEHKNKGEKMFNKLVPLDKEKHKSLKVSMLEDLNFAKDLTFIPVLANEVALVAQTFPVVFTADEEPTLVALTSLGGGNLAINEEGKFITRYIPAFLRKYPFALAPKGDGTDEMVVLIDEGASNVSKTKGRQLFTKDGKESQLLQNSIAFLQEYEQQNILTRRIAKMIADSGILEDREISSGEGEQKQVFVRGFRVVSREKLNALDDATLARWVREGIIDLIDDHLKSLANIEVLYKLASQAQQSETGK